MCLSYFFNHFFFKFYFRIKRLKTENKLENTSWYIHLLDVAVPQFRQYLFADWNVAYLSLL